MIRPFLLSLTYGLSIVAMPYRPAPIPSLQELCIKTLIAIPPEQFDSFHYLPSILKSQFILKYGPTYNPSIFSIATDHDSEDHSRIKGAVLDQQNLRLRNRFIDLLISKENPNQQQDESELSSPLYTFASLHHDKLYIGTQSGDIVTFTIKQRKPLLVDIQPISQHAIVELAVHPTVEHLIACRYVNGTIEILKRDNNMVWNRIKSIANNHQMTTHMSFSPFHGWLARSELFKAYLYTIDQKEELLEPIKSYVCPASINALIFDENENLIIQTVKGPLAIPHLSVWKFLSEDEVSSYITWHNESKITLRQDGSHDVSINDNEISTIADQIMFKAQLANIKTYAQLAYFKKYADALKCGELPLFKIIAITNKAAELQR